MVRAVKLEQSPSGTYTNASQGVFQSLNPAVSTPAITLTQPTNNSIFIAPVNLRIYASLFDPAALITNVTFYTNGQVFATDPSPPFTVTWTNPPLGIYSLTATADSVTGLTTNSAPVTITIDNGGKPLLSITPIGTSSNVITGQDILGRVYRLQSLMCFPPPPGKPLAPPPPPPPAPSSSPTRTLPLSDSTEPCTHKLSPLSPQFTRDHQGKRAGLRSGAFLLFGPGQPSCAQKSNGTCTAFNDCGVTHQPSKLIPCRPGLQ